MHGVLLRSTGCGGAVQAAGRAGGSFHCCRRRPRRHLHHPGAPPLRTCAVACILCTVDPRPSSCMPLATFRFPSGSPDLSRPGFESYCGLLCSMHCENCLTSSTICPALFERHMHVAVNPQDSVSRSRKARSRCMLLSLMRGLRA